VVLFSPAGERLDHAGVQGWSDSRGAVLVCGRYEGIDQRFIDACVDRADQPGRLCAVGR
jgi:tRNA (guanine37-N1)-methyltransferase